MKKIFLFSFVGLFSLGLFSCDKSKICSCTYISEAYDEDEEFDEDELAMFNQTTTYTEKAESGNCSDLNAKSSGTNWMGITLKETITCTEQ